MEGEPPRSALIKPRSLVPVYLLHLIDFPSQEERTGRLLSLFGDDFRSRLDEAFMVKGNIPENF